MPPSPLVCVHNRVCGHFPHHASIEHRSVGDPGRHRKGGPHRRDTDLTIGYGDLTPRHVVSRFLAVVIGFSGIVLTGVVAAIAVKALDATTRDPAI